MRLSEIAIDPRNVVDEDEDLEESDLKDKISKFAKGALVAGGIFGAAAAGDSWSNSNRFHQPELPSQSEINSMPNYFRGEVDPLAWTRYGNEGPRLSKMLSYYEPRFLDPITRIKYWKWGLYQNFGGDLSREENVEAMKFFQFMWHANQYWLDTGFASGLGPRGREELRTTLPYAGYRNDIWEFDNPREFERKIKDRIKYLKSRK